MKKIIFTILFASVLVFPQQRNLENKFRIAQNYEAIGDWESAVKIYEEIYAADSTNFLYFDALLRGYDQLKKYDAAIRIIKSRLQKQPNDINLLSKLGKMFARSGEIKEAENVWQSIIDANLNNLSVYSIVANAMIESRFFENALRVYQQGRKISKVESAFAAEMGYLHSLLMNYIDATREYLILLKQSAEQLNFIQSRISMYTSKSEGLKSAIFVTESALQKEPKNISLNRLIAWLYMEGKDYEKAFSIYKIIDELTKAGGKEIFTFAEKAKRERAYSTASKAFQEIIINYPKFQNISAVKFGFAETLENSLEEADSIRIIGDVVTLNQNVSRNDSVYKIYNDIVTLYKQVAEEFPNTDYASRALYRVANVYFRKFFDIEGSLKAVNEIENKYRFSGNIYVDAILLKSKLLIVKDEIAEAISKLEWIAKFQGATVEQKDMAKYILAELNYFLGNFQVALAGLQEILKNQSSDIVNDAIALQVLIQDNLEDEKNLILYSKSQFLKRQHKYEKAIELLREISKTKSELATYSISEIGDILTLSGDYKNALAEYEYLLTNFPDDLLADKTIFKIAEIYNYALKDFKKAEEYYKKLLEEYPSSIYVNIARQKIREIRGDVL
ncbi:MAG: hypothetical protein IGBAC_0162 [Ignavibacteriae bacterium]|nr:MAG: hypothetical protein IGBAC_0162 [Ignavibacteriota bacterium]